MTGQEARDSEYEFLTSHPTNGIPVASPAPQEAREDEREALGVTVEPIAFAVYGRSTGGLKYVSEWDEDDAREAAQFYDVVPLHRAERARKHPEPECEYGVRLAGEAEPYTGVSRDLDWILDHALAVNDDEIVKRRLAGPWVPVGEGEQG